MKSVPLNKFHSDYVKIIRDALKRNQEVLVTCKGRPFFIATPVRSKGFEKVKENPAPGFVRVTKKFKGKKVFSVPYLIG
jgi:hypothetical protein